MWWTLLPYIAVTMLVVFVPGFAINLALGFRPLTALGLAPLVSTGVVALAAIAANLLGFGWGPIPIVVLTALLALVGYGPRRWSGGQPSAEPNRSQTFGFGWPLAGLGLAALLLGRDGLRILAAPTNFSQTYDNIFHLNAVRWIVEHRNGSAFDMRMVTGDAPAQFYPTAWHDLASATLLSLGRNDPVQATSALILVSMALIWPLSCLLLVRRIMAVSPLGTLCAGVLAAAFTPLPYLLLRFGVLYPNHLGLCLLPAMMAIAVSLLELGDGPRWPVFPTWAAAGLGMISLGLAHPNVALTMVAVIGSVMITCWALPVVAQGLRRRSWTMATSWRAAVFVGWAVLALGLYVLIRPPQLALFWGPVRSYTDALIEAVLIAPLETTVVVVPALLTVAGAVAVIWQRRHWWLLGAHAALCLLWVVAAARDYGRLRDYIVGPWYNDPYRLAAMLPVTALPLACVGVVFIAGQTAGWLAGRHGSMRTRPGRWAGGVAVSSAVVLIAATQLVGGKPQVVDWVRESYQITATAALVDSDEYAVLAQLPGLVDADEVIAVNPWNGSSMVYALTGRHTTATHVLYEPDADTQVLIEHLDDVATQPQVCPAIRDLHVGWVLDFGNDRLINDERRPYPGWADLSTAPGFELVVRQGHAALYRVTACGLG